jgi:hypothetical protein
MTAGSTTLTDVAARNHVLVVGCTRCEQAGQYPVAALMARTNIDTVGSRPTGARALPGDAGRAAE